MIVCVQLFGLPSDITQLQSVDIELNDGAGLRDLIAALKHKIPALEGRVFRTGEDRLLPLYSFNVNGRFSSVEGEFQLQSGDNIALITLASGG